MRRRDIAPRALEVVPDKDGERPAHVVEYDVQQRGEEVSGDKHQDEGDIFEHRDGGWGQECERSYND